MKILVVGATGYIGSATARALRQDGHAVTGLARSEASAARLHAEGLRSQPGDFRDPPSLAAAVEAQDPDIVVVIASAGGGLGDADAFSADRNAVQALAAAMAGRGRTLIFTSGSAVFGVFAAGERADPAFAEDTSLPLPRAVFAPPSAGAAERFVEAHEAAIGARLEAERAVLAATGVRGLIIRPGNVWGLGGSVDIPKYIELARAHGVAPHWGAGGATQGYVHLDDVVDLYRLAIVRGRPGGIYHAARRRRASARWGWRSGGCSASATAPRACRWKGWPSWEGCAASGSASTSASRPNGRKPSWAGRRSDLASSPTSSSVLTLRPQPVNSKQSSTFGDATAEKSAGRRLTKIV